MNTWKIIKVIHRIDDEDHPEFVQFPAGQIPNTGDVIQIDEGLNSEKGKYVVSHRQFNVTDDECIRFTIFLKPTT